MGKPKRPCEQLEEEEEEAQQGVLVGGEEQLDEDEAVVVITRTTIITPTTMMMTTMMEVDLPAEVVEEVLGQEGGGLVREEHGEEGVVLEILVWGGKDDQAMVRSSLSHPISCS